VLRLTSATLLAQEQVSAEEHATETALIDLFVSRAGELPSKPPLPNRGYREFAKTPKSLVHKGAAECTNVTFYSQKYRI